MLITRHGPGTDPPATGDPAIAVVVPVSKSDFLAILNGLPTDVVRAGTDADVVTTARMARERERGLYYGGLQVK